MTTKIGHYKRNYHLRIELVKELLLTIKFIRYIHHLIWGGGMKGKTIFLIAMVVIIYAIYWAFGFGEIPESSAGLSLANHRYHCMIITRVTDEAYWEHVFSGVKAVAAQENVALECYDSRFRNIKELERYLEMAILSRIDGILLSVPNEPGFLSLIKEAAEKGIPVVALVNEFENKDYHSFIGINAYELGSKTGKALIDATSHLISPQIQVAVLVTASFSDYSYTQYLNGLESAIESNSRLNLDLIIRSKGGSISAEEQTQTILKNYPQIQAIVCSDVSDTLGVAKVVVDLNRVSQVTIIGSGLNSEIVRYIKRNVISGVLTDDPYELGTQGLLALLRLIEGHSQKENYYLPIFMVNSTNVDEMFSKLIMEERAGEEGE